MYDVLERETVRWEEAVSALQYDGEACLSYVYAMSDRIASGCMALLSRIERQPSLPWDLFDRVRCVLADANGLHEDLQDTLLAYSL